MALTALIGGATPAPTLTLPLGLPWLGAHFRIDALTAFFLLVVNLGLPPLASSPSGMAAISADMRGASLQAATRSPPEWALPFFPAFLAAMNLVVLADDAFTFLVSWEFMSLTSWALVLTHHRVRDNIQAGCRRLSGRLAALARSLPPPRFRACWRGRMGKLCVFAAISGRASPTGVAALIGADPHSPRRRGSKAGLVPLHAWLPLAHPAAPSHVSALMSGVMTKVAVYGFVRIVLDLLGPPDWWWSMLVLAPGGITAVMGVLYALMQRDLKRLLAYSTVENIGIIFIGLGLGLAFKSYGMPGAAALALTAALFHVFNHALFKSLLFFGAGAVLGATGERDLEHIGRSLFIPCRATAFAFLAGCVAILRHCRRSMASSRNGSHFQAILLSPQLPSWGLKLLVPAVGALLALSAAPCGRLLRQSLRGVLPGAPAHEPSRGRRRDLDRWSLAAMLTLAALCLFAGILPGLFIDALAPVVSELVGERMPVQTGTAWLSIVPIAESRSSYNGLLVFLFIAISATLAASAIHRLTSTKLRRGPAWDCGYPDGSPATQYSADSFAQPIRRVFGTIVFGAREKIDMPPPGSLAPARFEVILRDRIWEAVYAPLADGVVIAATS